MDSKSPLYRQLASRFYLLVFSFVLLFFVGFSFYFQYQQDFSHSQYQQLPALKQFNQRQLLLIKHDRLLSEIISSKYATNFADQYLALQTNLKQLSDLSRNNRHLLEQLMQKLKSQSENVTLLTENDRRNIQLKDNVIIQLALISDNLAYLITEQSNQQKALYRQINEDNAATRLLVNRAKAHTVLIANLKVNHELHQSLVETSVMFNQLDLQFDLVEFDYFKLNIQQKINYWLENASTAEVNSPSENALIEQISVLNDLLFNEQSTLAKWRGQLRMAIEFQTELAQQKLELRPLLDKTLVIQSLNPSIVEQQLVTLLAMLNIEMQPKYYQGFIVGVFLIISIIFISLLINLRNKIKRYGVNSIDAVQEFVTTGNVSTPVSTLEVATIIKAIKQLSLPLHSEADFQRQQQQFKAHNLLMTRHTGNVFWQLPVVSKKLQRKLSALFAGEPSQKHWRHFFSRTDVRTILASARQAREHKRVEKLSLISNQEKAVAVTIEFIDGAWCGSVCNIEEYRALKDVNSQLNQQLQQQNQRDKLATIARSENALTMLNNTIVQKQVLSLAQHGEPAGYQEIKQLLRLNEQQKTSAQLRLDDFVLSLSSVPLANEVQTALANVGLSQGANNNFIYLNMADNLAPLVTLESELFQSMIATICEKMFTKQENAELDVALKVIDVNSAQQKVRISFTMNKSSQLQALFKVINELAFNEQVTAEYDNATDNYLRDLQLVFNITNKVSQSFDEGGQFSFDMPFALAEGSNQQGSAKVYNLAKRSLLVIATDKPSRERVCQALVNSKATVETMQDLLLFQRQISIKHLTQHPIDAIIIAAEVYQTDHDLITQHIASLPAKLQPKILVIQPFNCQGLQRNGMFSLSNLPWFSETIIDNVERLINGKNQINLLVEPEIFTPFRFLPSPIDVLVAVKNSAENQCLIRMLHWLGLQVTLVSQQEHLERLWQSGRYLVVISQFDDFNMTLSESQSLVRGVFVLNHETDKNAKRIKNKALPNSWHVEYLAPVLDIQNLVEQLSPWLTPNLVVADEKNSASADKRVSNNKPWKSTTPKASVSVKQVPSIADFEQLLGNELTDHKNQAQSLPDDAFDLNQYAQNQGSAELAAFMLEDYLADIAAEGKALIDAINAQNYTLAKQTLSALSKLAKVIAAKPVIAQCDNLSQMISNTSAENALSAKEYEALLEQINNLKLLIVQLTEFAEAI